MEFEVSNTRSNNTPCIWVKYCDCQDKLKLWINLATFYGNIWSKLKSPTIKILCCVGSSLNKKSHQWLYQEDLAYNTLLPITKVSFSISITAGNTSKILGISTIIIPNNQVVKEKLHLKKFCNLIGFLIHNSTTKPFSRHDISQNNDQNNFWKIHFQKI